MSLKIDLGCGSNKKEGYIGVDILDVPGVDYVTDLSKNPLPFDPVPGSPKVVNVYSIWADFDTKLDLKLGSRLSNQGQYYKIDVDQDDIWSNSYSEDKKSLTLDKYQYTLVGISRTTTGSH